MGFFSKILEKLGFGGDKAATAAAPVDTAAEDAAAAAIGAYLGAETAELFLPAEKGEAYIAADGDIPAGCVWGLSFD